MKNAIIYNGFTIEILQNSHCASVYNSSGELIKMLAGGILPDGSNTAAEKAKNWIDSQFA
jgi:hypothetical protein